MKNYAALPERLQGGAQRYIEHGVKPGSFLTAVICNDLREACGCADDDMRLVLFDIVSWFHNEAPALCWGSREKMAEWLARVPA